MQPNPNCSCCQCTDKAPADNARKIRAQYDAEEKAIQDFRRESRDLLYGLQSLLNGLTKSKTLAILERITECSVIMALLDHRGQAPEPKIFAEAILQAIKKPSC